MKEKESLSMNKELTNLHVIQKKEERTANKNTKLQEEIQKNIEDFEEKEMKLLQKLSHLQSENVFLKESVEEI